MKIPDGQSCRTCRYYEGPSSSVVGPAASVGGCYFLPPVVTARPHPLTDGAMLVTAEPTPALAEAWCSSYRRKKGGE